MTRSESLVHQAYADNSHLWEAAWKKSAIRQLAVIARGYLRSMLPIEIDEQIVTLADPVARSGYISNDPAAAEIVQELGSAQGDFRPAVASLFQTGGVRMPSGGQLRTILTPLVHQSIRSVQSSVIVASISTVEVYEELAYILSNELHQLAVVSGDSDERLILNHAILIYHLHRWNIPFAKLRLAVQRFNSGPLEIRGWLISIQNRHPHTRAEDLFHPPATAFTPTQIPVSLQRQSDVLRVVQSESESIFNNNGFFHRPLPLERPASPENLALSPIATQELIEAGRRIQYPQYEKTALLFMSLSGIEFLLRSHCSTATAPDQALDEVIDLICELDQPIKGDLKRIFSSDEWNIRHRCMHGSFLEIEGRLEDQLRSSGILEIHGVPRIDLSGDGSLPGSVSALTIRSLSELSRQLDHHNLTFDRTWTDHFLLTAAEFQFAREIHCEFLQSLESAESWRQQIRDFVNEYAPCLSVPLQMGLRCWFMNGSELDTLPGFYFLALLFEPFLRLRLHFEGCSILQRGISRNGGTAHYRVQYRMMDDNGLLTTDNTNLLTAHLDPAEKPHALEILRLAVKCRDAFAHGAVWEFTEQLRLVYGHTIVKAIQLVVERGLRHPTPS